MMDATPLETLIEHALAHNPEVQAARYAARAAGARVPQAASLPDPQLTTMALLEAIQTAAGPQEIAMSLSQAFPFHGKRALRSQVAYHDAMAAYARATAVELGVVERVKRAYYDVAFLSRAIEATRLLEPRLQDVVAIVRAKHRTNQAGLESVYRAEIEVSSLQMQLVELQQAKIAAQARLAGILHLPGDTRIEAAMDATRPRVTETAETLTAVAESCQPELDAQRREVVRDRTSVSLARRDYWPDATVSFNWFGIGSSGLSPVATGEDAFSLGVGVNLPLYRSRLDAAVREAQCKTARSSRQLDAKLDQMRTEIYGLSAQVVQHQRVLEILRTQVLQRAEPTLELSIEAYRVGKLEFQQMIESYQSLLRFRIDYHRRVALREQTLASLERAVGTAITAAP
ncbi:MAG: TolC family protein [Pirellulales bacterium]|nr:TolC family protein [Pirellulales bacterium]